MIEPAVVIEIAPREAASPALVSALVSACTEAVIDGECALVGPEQAPPRGGPVATALVTFVDADRRVVRIAMVIPRKGHLDPVSRELAFAPQDAEIERWRAVGLVIATVVGQARDEERAPDARPPAAPPPVERPPPVPGPVAAAPARSPSWLWIDAGVLAGPALDDGSWRVGAGLRASVPVGTLPFFALASLRYSARPADAAGVSVRWASASLGAGAYFEPASAVRLQLRLEGLAESVGASVTEPGTASSDDGSFWVGGARAGADAVWMAHANVGAFIGLDASLLQGGTLVRVHGQDAARSGALSFTPALGLRVALP